MPSAPLTGADVALPWHLNCPLSLSEQKKWNSCSNPPTVLYDKSGNPIADSTYTTSSDEIVKCWDCMVGVGSEGLHKIIVANSHQAAYLSNMIDFLLFVLFADDIV